jgi:hypothetical protein
MGHRNPMRRMKGIRWRWSRSRGVSVTLAGCQSHWPDGANLELVCVRMHVCVSVVTCCNISECVFKPN